MIMKESILTTGLENLLTFKMRTEYLNNTRKVMKWLGEQSDTIFLGQTCRYDGSPIFASLKDVPLEKRIELPVIEDTQMGMSIGLALEGYVPISIYPRMDFLLCATNQLINHLNHCEEMSNGEFKPGVIIRCQIGNTEPLYPGIQHCSDHTEGLEKLCTNIEVIKLVNDKMIIPLYKKAYSQAKRGKSTILVEAPQGVF